MRAFLLLSLLALAAPDKKPENSDSIVLGRRYDFQVEVFERLQRYREATQEVLRARERFRSNVSDGLGRVLQAQDRLPTWQARVGELAGLLEDLSLTAHPACRYAANGTGGDLLVPVARAMVDIMRAFAHDRSRQNWEAACGTGPLAADPQATAMCRVLASGDPAGCEQADEETRPACRQMLDPYPIRSGADQDRGAMFLMAYAHALRTGSFQRCEESGIPWLTRMCEAARRGDAGLCPTWVEWREAPRAGGLTQGAAGLLRDRELALDVDFTPPAGPLRVLAVTRVPVACTAYKFQGEQREDLLTVHLPASQGVATLWRTELPPDRVPPGTRVSATCRVEASRQ
jgi:hypothetical protein